MDAGGGGLVGRRRFSRETSPDRARVSYSQRPRASTAATTAALRLCRKVQIVYYLSRNGQLEHPHFMELPQHPNQHLRLKDVMDRLTVLRGRGLPSLFSWSCKRSYKNGYVWNDLSENDVIYPAYGAEYVLKGSEIIQDSSERFQQLQVSERRLRPLPITHSIRLQLEAEEEVEDDDDEKDGGNLTAGANTPSSRCSRGVSTDEIEQQLEKPNNKAHSEILLDDGASPPSSSSSEKAVRQRFEDGEPEAEPCLSRNSVLLQLISCGSAAAAKGKGGCSAGSSPAGVGASGRKSGSLHKGVLSRLANRVAGPELGELNRARLEDKEYFSGSIVEAITGCGRAPPEPSLKKSSSYNEERASKVGIAAEAEGVAAAAAAEEEGCKGTVKGRCIPGTGRKARPTSKQTAAAASDAP